LTKGETLVAISLAAIPFLDLLIQDLIWCRVLQPRFVVPQILY
jgi:hypothetical protein